MKKKAIVLLSGGLDSVVNLYEAHGEFQILRVLTINYGQKAYHKERKASQFYCDELGLELTHIDISWLKEVSPSALTSDAHLPKALEVQIDSMEQSKKTAKAVWVPNRNGLFLNMAAVYGDALNADYIIPGFNLEEAATFPDNSQDFLKATSEALYYSTQNQLNVHCFTIDMNKTQILDLALKLKVDIRKLWPCYSDQEKWCGECESCQRFIRACKSNGIKI